VLFAVEATRRWEGDGITANALQPGTVRSNLQRYITDDDLERTRTHIEDDSGSFHWKTPEQGAATIGAARDLTAARGDRRPLLSKTATRQDQASQAPVMVSPATRSTPDAAERLWEISLQTLAS